MPRNYCKKQNRSRIKQNPMVKMKQSHANFSRLCCEFCHRLLHNMCRTSVVKIFMCRELVAKVLNLFKNFMRFFSPKYFARLARHIFSKLDRNSRISRINAHSIRLQHKSYVYIVNLCRKIVANYSGTSLQLSHSSEIGT